MGRRRVLAKTQESPVASSLPPRRAGSPARSLSSAVSAAAVPPRTTSIADSIAQRRAARQNSAMVTAAAAAAMATNSPASTAGGDLDAVLSTGAAGGAELLGSARQQLGPAALTNAGKAVELDDRLGSIRHRLAAPTTLGWRRDERQTRAALAIADGQEPDMGVPPDIRARFEVFDGDNDGFLSADELRSLLVSRGVSVADSHLNALMGEFETHGPGRGVNLTELDRLLDYVGGTGTAANRS
eukprot:SAG22_NODE_3702_length_1567_cov_1.303815_2_plen_242_part_00